MKTTKRRKAGHPDPAIVADAVKCVVSAVEPEKIILFGSAARGTMGPDSDLDLLVIKGGKFNRDRVIRDVYRSLRNVEIAIDVVVATPEEIERYRDSYCLVIYPAIREGRTVYAAETAATGRSTRVAKSSKE